MTPWRISVENGPLWEHKHLRWNHAVLLHTLALNGRNACGSNFRSKDVALNIMKAEEIDRWEWWRAGGIKARAGKLFQGWRVMEWQLLPPSPLSLVSPCSFSASLYQIPLCLPLLTLGPSVPRTFPTTDPSLHQLSESYDKFRTVFPMSCGLCDTCHLPTTAWDRIVYKGRG